MNWLRSLQQSIDYIEENILDKKMITSAGIADEIFSSEYNFRKIFSVITGFTVGEYVRNRRLSLAGEELMIRDTSILDIAVKYGYDTGESFTKAFTRFHGVTPSYVRKNKCSLKTFTRVKLKVETEGGNILNYTVEELGKIRIVGFEKCFPDSDTQQNNIDIPRFVKKCCDTYFDEMVTYASESTFSDSVLGYRDEVNGQLHFTFGVCSEKAEVDEKYSVVEVPPGCWLKFSCEPPTVEAMQRLWYRIYTEFMPFSSYQVADNITLEISYCMNGKNEKYLYMWIKPDKS